MSPRPLGARGRAAGLPQLLVLAGATFLAVVAVGVCGPTLWAHPANPFTAATKQLAGLRYYPNCQMAHAVGVYSIRQGEPSYRVPLDRDRDGLACEPYAGR